jgi:hypothetical protein
MRRHHIEHVTDIVGTVDTEQVVAERSGAQGHG